jgi:mycofactocin system glycosyltransferase
MGDRRGRQTQLPDGFVVRLNRHTRVVDGGAVLVGGSPTRISRLKRAALGRIRDGELTVMDASSRALAAHLLSTGMADPVVERLPPVELSLATVVIPVHDRSRQLDRVLAGLGGALPVIVVDDASADEAATAAVAAAHVARLIRLARNVGPAGARNAGLAAVTTPFVVFVDSDVVADPAAIELMLRHFADPALAMVAPRVLGLVSDRPNWITRYEDARSSLDLGEDSSSVRPRSPVTWVSSTCLVARVELLAGRPDGSDGPDGIHGFDESMRVGEDVDLVWRLVDAGHRVRFEPAATVRHEHRTTLRTWLGRKFFYGTGAEPLAERHPDDIAPVVLAPWAGATLVAVAAQRRWSLPVVAAVGVVTALRIGRRATAVRRPYPLAARLTGNGLIAAIAQGFALLLRHWWPLTAIACLVSKRVRRAALFAAVADTVWEYARTKPRLDPLRFALARRLDDAAYGAGVWWSALRARTLRPLLPDLRRQH